MSATGLRSIRYAKEVKGIKCIVANDISNKAIEAIRNNIVHNGVENIVKPSHEDATYELKFMLFKDTILFLSDNI